MESWRRMRATMACSSSTTSCTVIFETFSLISLIFFSRLCIIGPALFTILRVTIWACSSSMRLRYSPSCSRAVALRCSMVASSWCSFTMAWTAAFSGPSARSAEM